MGCGISKRKVRVIKENLKKAKIKIDKVNCSKTCSKKFIHKRFNIYDLYKILFKLSSGYLENTYLVEEIYTGIRRSMKIFKIQDILNEEKKEIQNDLLSDFTNSYKNNKNTNDANINHSNILQNNYMDYLTSELNLLIKLEHNNINKIIEFYTDDYFIYIILEFCHYEDLLEGISNWKNYSEEKACFLIYHILLAVNYLHSNSIVHSDIRPENIIFTKPSKDNFDIYNNNDSYKSFNIEENLISNYYPFKDLINQNYLNTIKFSNNTIDDKVFIDDHENLIVNKSAKNFFTEKLKKNAYNNNYQDNQSNKIGYYNTCDSLSIKISNFNEGKILRKKKHLEKAINHGNLYYLAPELIKSETYNEKIDVWSCGVIFYLLLIGNFPFEGNQKSEIINNIIQGKYEIDNKHWKSISTESKHLLRCMLTYCPNKRISAIDALNHIIFKKIFNIKSNMVSIFSTLSNNNINKNNEISNNNNNSINTVYNYFYLNSKNNINNLNNGEINLLKGCLEKIRKVNIILKLKEAIIFYMKSYFSLVIEINKLNNIFKKLDLNKNRLFSIDEVKACCEIIYGEEISDIEVRILIETIYVKRNRFIQYSEFINNIRNLKIFYEENKLKTYFCKFIELKKDLKLSKDEILNIFGHNYELNFLFINKRHLQDESPYINDFDRFKLMLDNYIENNQNKFNEKGFFVEKSIVKKSIVKKPLKYSFFDAFETPLNTTYTENKEEKDYNKSRSSDKNTLNLNNKIKLSPLKEISKNKNYRKFIDDDMDIRKHYLDDSNITVKKKALKVKDFLEDKEKFKNKNLIENKKNESEISKSLKDIQIKNINYHKIVSKDWFTEIKFEIKKPNNNCQRSSISDEDKKIISANFEMNDSNKFYFKKIKSNNYENNLLNYLIDNN